MKKIIHVLLHIFQNRAVGQTGVLGVPIPALEPYS